MCSNLRDKTKNTNTESSFLLENWKKNIILFSTCKQIRFFGVAQEVGGISVARKVCHYLISKVWQQCDLHFH